MSVEYQNLRLTTSYSQVPCTVWQTIMDCIEFNGFTVSEVIT
jgi:hypothetical protein